MQMRIFIESNHDLEMLRMGPYAGHLKQRILSDKHLSNDDGALAMCEWGVTGTKRIHLDHLSQDNNMNEIAYQTVESTSKRMMCLCPELIIRIRMNPQNYLPFKNLASSKEFLGNISFISHIKRKP